MNALQWQEEATRLGLIPVNVKAHPLIDCCITGILTPAAGRATQQLPGPRVVDGVLPAGRVLLVGRFILGACHGGLFIYLFIPKCAVSSPEKKNAEKGQRAMWWGEEAGEAAVSGVGGV